MHRRAAASRDAPPSCQTVWPCDATKSTRPILGNRARRRRQTRGPAPGEGPRTSRRCRRWAAARPQRLRKLALERERFKTQQFDRITRTARTEAHERGIDAVERRAAHQPNAITIARIPSTSPHRRFVKRRTQLARIAAAEVDRVRQQHRLHVARGIGPHARARRIRCVRNSMRPDRAPARIFVAGLQRPAQAAAQDRIERLLGERPRAQAAPAAATADARPRSLRGTLRSAPPRRPPFRTSPACPATPPMRYAFSSCT